MNTGLPSKGQREVGTQCTDPQDLYLRIRGEVGTQCTDPQDLYLKVRGEVGTQCTDTQDFYLKVRGELGTPWYTLRGLLSKGQRRGGNTVYRHT